MFKIFLIFLFSVGIFNADCMEQRAIACINIINSTNEKIRLSYVKSQEDISKITKADKDLDGKAIEIHSGKPMLLSESFSDFNQSECGDSEIEMCKIYVEYENAKIGVITLLGSAYSPCPFFIFDNIKNKFGIILHEEYPRGGGLNILRVTHFSSVKELVH